MRLIKCQAILLFFMLALAVQAYSQIPPLQPPPAVPDPLPEIVGFEYFFDTDPGFGNGIFVTITAADSLISEDFTADVSGLDAGRHMLYLRTLDENGKWSFISFVSEFNKLETSPVVVNPLPNIVAAEYFIDTDPGFGNGIAITVTNDSIIDTDFTAVVSSLEMGRHMLYLRTRDENGRWSLITYVSEFNKAITSPVVVDPLPDIVAAEYFIDTDPGFGNGIAIAVTNDSIIDTDFTAIVSDLELGKHMLYLRTLDEDGKWSLINYVSEFHKAIPSSVDMEPLHNIVAMEYFIDTDPGFGNATPIDMSADSLVDVDFNFDVSSWGTEIHLLGIRSLDELGRWTLVYFAPVTKGEMSRRMRHGKFFYDGIEQPMFTEDPPD